MRTESQECGRFPCQEWSRRCGVCEAAPFFCLTMMVGCARVVDVDDVDDVDVDDVAVAVGVVFFACL